MGCVDSKSEETREQEKANRLVETQLKRAKSEFLNEIKLLLLGTGESGKSTIAKQMKILHTGGFTKDELLTFKPIAIHNTVAAIKVLVKAVDAMQLSFDSDNKVYCFIKSKTKQNKKKLFFPTFQHFLYFSLMIEIIVHLFSIIFFQISFDCLSVFDFSFFFFFSNIFHIFLFSYLI
jgi:hypothetical protein